MGTKIKIYLKEPYSENAKRYNLCYFKENDLFVCQFSYEALNLFSF